MIIDFYKNGFEKIKMVFFVTSLVLLSLTGGRSLVIILLSFVFFVFIVVQHLKVSPMLIFGVGVLSVFVFLGNAVLRASDLETYLNKSSSYDFNNAFILDEAIKFNDNNNGYLVFFEDFYNMFIPRKFFPEKPMSTGETRLVFPEVASRGTNFTFGIYANSLVNVGYFFVIIIPLYLFLSSYLYIKYVLVKRQYDLVGFIVVFFLFYSIQFVRGGVFNSRLALILISILMAYSVFGLISRSNRNDKLK